MNILLWFLQVCAALLYGASGAMKTVFFDAVSGDVPSFGALPRGVWAALGVLELLCAAALVVPGLVRQQQRLTVAAAAILAAESLVFIGVHVKYDEVGSIVFSAALGLVMAFVAWGRRAWAPRR